jgi:hypothetical protein
MRARAASVQFDPVDYARNQAKQADLTRQVPPGKFDQVAPQQGREAELRCALDP